MIGLTAGLPIPLKEPGGGIALKDGAFAFGPVRRGRFVKGTKFEVALLSFFSPLVGRGGRPVRFQLGRA